MPVQAHRLAVDLEPTATAAHGIEATGAPLVRPDGFIAWRSEGRAADPAGELTRAMASILGR